MKLALTLILVSCSVSAYAQSWELDPSEAEIATDPQVYKEKVTPEVTFSSDDDAFSAFDEAVAPSSNNQRQSTTRRQPKAKPARPRKPVAAKVAPKPAPKPAPLKVASTPAPRATVQPPRPAIPSPFLNVDPAVFRMAPAAATQAQSGTTELPYNLRIENYDFKHNRVKPNPAFRTPPNLRSPILASLGYYDGQDDDVCTDPLLCASRAYNQTLSAQSRRLAQATSLPSFVGANGLTSSMNVREGEALPYVDLLTKNFGAGLKERRRKPMCAKAVRRILEASKMIPKDSPLRPEGAKDYRKFLENFGFRHNPQACNSPGVVRVYDKSSVPQCSRKRKTNCYKGRYSKGDTYGHVEILGKDRQYHHFTKSKRSIQEIFSPARRPLIGCMVKESGSR